MLSRKRVWIPILIVLLAVIGCSLFYSQKTTNQEPITIIKPVEMKQSTAPKPPLLGETHETGHWHGDHWRANDAHSEASIAESIVSDLNTDPQARIDAEIEAAHQQGATDAEILKQLQAAGHQVDADSDIQEALYRQRVRQYLKDREEWNQKFHQAHTERMQASEAVVSFIPNLSPNRSAEEITKYLDSLSDDERKQLFAEYDALVAKSEAAIKKLDAVKQEEPVYPTKK